MKYNFTLTIVILLLLVALRASQHIDRAVPKDLITEYLEDLRKLERAESEKKKEKEKEKEKSEATVTKNAASSTLLSFFLGGSGDQFDEKDNDEDCYCKDFDCFDDTPVDCECERALEASQNRVKMLEDRLKEAGLNIY